MFNRLTVVFFLLLAPIFAASNNVNLSTGAVVSQDGIAFDLGCNSQPYAVSGKALPSLFKDAVKVLPKQEGFDQTQVVLITDFPGWVKCNHLEAVSPEIFNPEQAGAFSNNALPLYVVQDQPDLPVAIANYGKGTADYLKNSIATWLAHELGHIEFKRQQVTKAEAEGRKFQYSSEFKLRSEEFALTAETNLRQEFLNKGKLPAGCRRDQQQAIAMLQSVRTTLANLQPKLTASR